MSIPSDITDILSIAFDGNIENYTITIPDDKKGIGFMGEVSFLTLQDKKSKEEKNLIVKKIINYPGQTGELSKCTFRNEIHFYEKILPALQNFTEGNENNDFFEKFPKCYATVAEDKLLLENLARDGFKLLEKHQETDKQHMKLICKFYGKYHGINFAFKHFHPEQNLNLVKDLVDISDFVIKANMCDNVLTFFKTYLERKEIFDAKLHKRLKMYAERGTRILADSIKYKGENAVILHGDCHANNMFFKYNEENEPIDMKLIDFQVTKFSTPVLDLSYLIYVSGSEDIIEELNYYLKVYHDSLNETLKKFDLDVSDVYSFDTLKKEWKEHSKFGIIMAILVWSVRTSKDEEIPNMGAHEDKEEAKKYESIDPFRRIKFRNLFEALVQHAYTNGFL